MAWLTLALFLLLVAVRDPQRKRWIDPIGAADLAGMLILFVCSFQVYALRKPFMALAGAAILFLPWMLATRGFRMTRRRRAGAALAAALSGLFSLLGPADGLF